MHLELRLNWTKSLKDKRKILKSIKDKVRNKYNVSIIESDYQNKWKRSLISVAQLAGNKKLINSNFLSIEQYISSNFSLELVESQKEFI